MLVGELLLNELSVSFKRPVQRLSHQAEGDVGSRRVHFKARLDLWCLHRSWWLLTFTFKHSAAPPCDWHLHKRYRGHIQMRPGPIQPPGLTGTFYSSGLLSTVVCVWGGAGDRRELIGVYLEHKAAFYTYFVLVLLPPAALCR